MTTININDLTLGQIRELTALFPTPSPSTAPSLGDSMIGKFCIARCYSAGVHAGTVVAVEGETVLLKDSYLLWDWEAEKGVALNGLAQTGQKAGKVDIKTPEEYLTGVCTLIPCTEKAKASIIKLSVKA